jgi:hypothetical protein
VESGKPLKTFLGHTYLVKSVAISPDGKRAISGSTDGCIIWDVDSGKPLKTLSGFTHGISSVAISPDGKRAISGSSDDTSCIIWDLESGNPLKTLFGHTSTVTSVALSPDGKRAISGSYDYTCIIWDMENGKPLKTLSGHTKLVNSVAISLDGNRAISGSDDKTCIIWDVESSEKVAKFIALSGVNATGIIHEGIFGGTKAKETFILQACKELLLPGTAIVTARHIWDFEFKKYQPLHADCPACGTRFSPDNWVVKTIEGITKEAGLNPNQSPCLELPDEAWEKPGLLSECPKCGEKLKFNPFIAGGEGY